MPQIIDISKLEHIFRVKERVDGSHVFHDRAISGSEIFGDIELHYVISSYGMRLWTEYWELIPQKMDTRQMVMADDFYARFITTYKYTINGYKPKCEEDLAIISLMISDIKSSVDKYGSYITAYHFVEIE